MKAKHPSPAHEQIVAALEASSGALRALEAAAVRRAEEGEHPEEQQQLDRAIELLRESIAELRLTEGVEPPLGAAGFIMAVRAARDSIERG
jgi:signal transduction histidine kinase